MSPQAPDNASLERAEIRKTTEKVKTTSQDVKASARNIEDSAVSIRKTTDRTTELAADRTVFAAERTYAAWVRTGLAALASGVGAKALLTQVIPDPMVMFASTVLVLFSILCFCAAVWRELVPDFQNPMPDARRIPRWILFAINGSLVIVSLTALIGLWMSRFGLLF